MRNQQTQKGYVNEHYLRETAALLGFAKQRSYQQMHLHYGAKVLDMGCGPGIDTCALAEKFGSTGQVIGIDQDTGLLSQADTLAQRKNLSGQIKHLSASAYQLPFPDQYFDAVRSERVFQHLENPQQALSELVRVTKNGGNVVLIDTDWSSVSIDTGLTGLERKITQAHTQYSCHNGYSGRQLYRLFKQQALNQINLESLTITLHNYSACRAVFLEEAEHYALTHGVINKQELAQWQQELQQRSEQGIFFCNIPSYLISGLQAV